MTQIYFTRHGETLWNTQGRLQGRLDSALTEKGVQQAKSLGERIKALNIDIVYSSSAPRALTTAKLAIGDLNIDIIPMDDLCEFDMGLWEGRPIEEILTTEKENFRCLIEDPFSYKPNTGEGCYSFVQRCQKALEKILQKSSGKRILIVSHGMTVKGLLWRFSSKDFEANWKETKILQQATLVHGHIDAKGNAILDSVPSTFPWGEDLLQKVSKKSSELER